jgi:mono/diheme cytochrome c family protein
MTARAKRTTWLLVIGAVALMGVFWLRTAESQTVQTQQVMRQKLVESQQLLGALTTSNWTVLAERSRELQALTNQPGWQVLQTPEFRTYTTDFQKAAQAVAAAAMQRDQRTALAAYTQLVTSCVECHRYVARARIASTTSR